MSVHDIFCEYMHETSVQSSFHLSLTRSRTCWSWTDTFFSCTISCTRETFALLVISNSLQEALLSSVKTVTCDWRLEILPLQSSASLLGAALVDWRLPQRVEAEGAGEEVEVPHCSPDVELQSRPSATLNTPGITKGALLKDSKAADPPGFPWLLCPDITALVDWA